MPKKSLRKYLLPFLLLFVLLGCGHRKNPTGGEKDTVNPEILSVFPLEFSDISDSDIEIIFSKPIERNTIIGGLLIYPPILQKKFQWDKNILTIKILEKLEKNTNYFFTFTTSIKDEHNNKLDKQYTFIFANGQLNENKISGNIVWEDDNDRNLKVNFSLLAPDSSFIESKIVGQTSFEFANLNNMAHILEAFADKNKNQKYDYGKEPYFYAYLEANEFLSVNAEMTYEDTLQPTIKSARAIWNNQVQFNFDEPVADFSKVEITTQDTLLQNQEILASYLEKDILTLITAPQDSLRYVATFYNLQDKKNNVNDSISIIFDGNVVPDSIPPQVTSSYPFNGETIIEDKPLFIVHFDEIIRKNDLFLELINLENKESVPLRIVSADSKVCKFTPSRYLTNYSSYKLSIRAQDWAGNLNPQFYQVEFIVVLR